MAGGDKTGPRGEGPLTGRQAGYCSGEEQPGFRRPRFGFGRGQAFGRRRGFWPQRYAEQDVEQGSSLLKEVKDLKDLISNLQRKVDDLEKKD
ncbi:MAG: DUF5320 domain-containing protein [Anaerolineaceae bacterium]|nr:DUF5320 domain-containing protein [Anaerolineaceae bacterium]